MIDSMELILDVNVEQQAISTVVNINIKKDVKILDFGLNKLLNIDSVNCNNCKANYEIEDVYKLEFRPDCQKVIIYLDNQQDEQKLQIKYTGSICGIFNYFTEKLIALNFYSAWYPAFTNDVSIAKYVKITGLDKYRILKGCKNGKIWEYNANDFDCNIIAVKDWQSKSRKTMGSVLNVFYNITDRDNIIDSMITSFENIITYYVNLLGTNPITANSFDIVINSEDNTGGYCRNNLIVLCEIHKKSIVFECWLAHEFAHCWATGADVFSWEDWLNETFAESLALLYIRNLYGEKEYSIIIDKIKLKATKLPAVKTKDGSRPDGVHVKGTYLMHELSEEFGIETLNKIIKIFVNLENKNTDSLLTAIKEQIGLDVAEYIDNRLTL